METTTDKSQGDYSPGTTTYVGTKIVNAAPMKHEDFLRSQGKEIDPNAETMGDGYEVIYDDNYRSWSPKAVFERCYREITVNEKRMMS